MKELANKKLVYTSAIILFVLVGLFTFYKLKKKQFLQHGLKELVNEKTNSIYSVNYDSIRVDEVAGDVSIKNLRVTTDTLRQLQMIKAGDTNALKTTLEIQIPILHVKGFKTAKALLSKQLVCDSIFIDRPIVTINIYPGSGSPKDEQAQQKLLYQQILGNLKLLRAGKVIVNNAAVSAYNFYTKEKKFEAVNTSINLLDVAIDSTFNRDTSRTLFCKEISIYSDRILIGDKTKNAAVSGFEFNTSSQVIRLAGFDYDDIKNNGVFQTAFSGISLTGAKWKGPMEDSDVEIDKTTIEKGELVTLTGDKPAGTGKPKTLLNGWLRSFRLGLFELKALSYTSQPIDKSEKPFVISNNSFRIQNININRKTVLDKSFFQAAEVIDVNNKEIRILSSDRFYQLRLAGLRLNTATKKITAQSIQVLPQYNEPDFVRKAHYQTDRYDINFKKFECSGVDMQELLNGTVHISNITADNSSIKVFRDLSYPIDSASKRSSHATFPQQLIHKLNFKVRINKFTAGNLFVEYKEKNPISNSSGRVQFVNSTLTIRNISNEPAAASEKMVASFSTSFLGKIPMTGSFTFPLGQWRKGVFMTEASVQQPFDATILNQLAQPMSLARIEKGTFNSIKFSSTADSAFSHGNLYLSYDDLKLSLLKKKGDQYDKRPVMSLVANILVKNKNKEGDNMRTANPVVPRNLFKSFFNYTWLTIFKGMQQILLHKL